MKTSKRTIEMVFGAILLLGVWELIGRLKLFGMSFPAFSTVVGELISPNRSALFGAAIAATALSASLGLLIGGGSGILIAAIRQSISPTRPGLDRLAAAIHAIPQIAIAPVLIIIFGREDAPIAVSSIAAFFPAYAAATRAFATAAGVHQDLFAVFGANRWDRLTRLELPAALPGLADAARLAAPGAVLGAVLGEWFGAPRGVGLLILSASQNYNIPLLWAAATLSALMAMVGFAVFTLLQQAATRRFA